VFWPVESRFEENCTHLILWEVKRTEKYLCSCAAGKVPICVYMYINMSINIHVYLNLRHIYIPLLYGRLSVLRSTCAHVLQERYLYVYVYRLIYVYIYTCLHVYLNLRHIY
jgi:hypothetical protein